MKKAILGVVLCLSLAVFGFSTGFSIKINGGANFLMGGDYNKIITDANADPNILGYPATGSGELKQLTMGWNFGAEFILNFTDEIGLGLGVGYITASNDSTLTSTIGIVSLSSNYKPSASVIPITLNFHYFLPLGDAFKFHFTAGPGLYLSTFEFDAHFISTLLATDYTETFTPSSLAVFGFQGGLGFEIAVSPSVSLCVDALGRMANISGLKGSHTLSGTILGVTGSISHSSDTFYYYEYGGRSFAAIQANPVSGTGISSAREASVSLSGICAMAGIKINI